MFSIYLLITWSPRGKYFCIFHAGISGITRVLPETSKGNRKDFRGGGRTQNAAFQLWKKVCCFVFSVCLITECVKTKINALLGKSKRDLLERQAAGNSSGLIPLRLLNKHSREMKLSLHRIQNASLTFRNELAVLSLIKRVGGGVGVEERKMSKSPFFHLENVCQ